MTTRMAAISAGQLVRVPARCPGPALERGLKLLDRVGQDRLVAAPYDSEAQRPVDRRQVPAPQSLGLPLPEADAGDAHPVGKLVVERHGITSDVNHPGQSLKARPGVRIYQLGWVQGQPGLQELSPGVYRLKLFADEGAHAVG